MMKKLQKLGKALMLPVAALPICGILMGLGYAIAPGVMGVPGAATSGALYEHWLPAGKGRRRADRQYGHGCSPSALQSDYADDREGTAGTGRSGILADDDQPAEHRRCYHADARHRGRSGQDAGIRQDRERHLSRIHRRYHRCLLLQPASKTRSFRTGWHSSAASAALPS